MTTDITAYMQGLGAQVKASKRHIRLSSHLARQDALRHMSAALISACGRICEENEKDVRDATEKDISEAMIDRLRLDERRIRSMADSLFAIADAPDPIGSPDQEWSQPNGLLFERVRIPIGAIGMIYESRPNVTADAAALCLKSGNSFLLRGGSECIRSNRAIFKVLKFAAETSELGHMPGLLVDIIDRAAVGEMLKGLDGALDMIIPRGGKGLVARVMEEARIPVLSHLDGICHTYVHADADQDMACTIVQNAKMRRTGICGATETLLMDHTIAQSLLPRLAKLLHASGCELRGCDVAVKMDIPGLKPATAEDFATEHLSAILNVKITKGLDDALTHIDTYGSGHTDSIVTDNLDVAAQFQREVDSAIVMHNCSTQFADGGEFGFGAEIGIATGRLHARGPVGAQHLTTFKYTVKGEGHLRP